MHTLVQVARNRQSSAAAAALMADYLVFDRQRRQSRPFVQLFAGFAVLVLIGGAAGRVPGIESMEAAGVFLVPVLALLAAHFWRWSRLQHRLTGIRAEIQHSDS